MWDGIVPAIFLLSLITIIPIFAVERKHSVCKISFSSETVAEILLAESDTILNEATLSVCPGTIRRLTIKETFPKKTRYLSVGLFSDKYLDLESLTINVNHLIFETGLYNGDRTSNLRSLSLSNCNLSSIPSLGAFYLLAELRNLDLSGNRLTDFPPDLFTYTTRLKLANLSYNSAPFLPKITSALLVPDVHRIIDVSMNPISCSCTNTWLSKEFNFTGLPACKPWPASCPPILSAMIVPNFPQEFMNDSLSILSSESFTLKCIVNSTLPVEVFWISPIGVIPLSTNSYSYSVQPILATTVVNGTRVSDKDTILHVDYSRGHLSGDWYCVAHSDIDLTVSRPLRLNVFSSMYFQNVYYFSLCYGYSAMLILLLIGIIGGTIRYCHETHCLRRPQPPFAYGGKTFIGVIPVPEVDETSTKRVDSKGESFDIAESNVQYMAAGRLCNICFKPPTYWFCSDCKAIHFVQSVRQFIDQNLPDAAGDLPIGELTRDGEIKLHTDTVDTPEDSELLQVDAAKVHEPLIQYSNDSNRKSDDALMEGSISTKTDNYLYVCSGGCVIRLRPSSTLNETTSTSEVPTDFRSVSAEICVHFKPRPNSADVKLIVSNEKLAEEYRDALADLARAVESPDPAHFRENLELFRNRLRLDVGHGVKVLRGEFRGLRAKSAKGVANLRTQSSAAAQRMRAGLSHGMEQVKGSMRSMAELCGGSGTIGQTISVVNVYVDEADQTKKERVISDFVF